MKTFVVCFCLLPFFANGCQSTCQFENKPRVRLRALSFTGLSTFYEVTDPQELGMQRYSGWDNLVSGSREQRRIVHTCAGGFLDLDHVRTATDWTKHLSIQIEEGLRNEQYNIIVVGDKPRGAHAIHVDISIPVVLAGART